MPPQTLINKYFEGTSTVEEERLLKQILASDEFQGPEIDEARAVIGIFAVKRNQAKKQRRRTRLATISRAACLGLLIVGGTVLFTRIQSKPDDSIALINGFEVSQAQALSQMQRNLKIFAETSADVRESVNEDFESMSTIFTE